MNTKFMSLSLVAALVLTACSSDSTDDNTEGGTSSNPTVVIPSTTEPLVPYSCEGTYTQNGTVYTNNMSADGELKVECVNNAGHLSFNNVNELSIAQVISSDAINTEESDGSTINITITTDSLAGTQSFIGTSSMYGALNCVSTYDTSSLPGTIYDVSDISIYVEFDNAQLIATTCPDWVNDESDDMLEPVSAVFLSNTTITATNGTVSHYSNYFSY